MQHIGNGTKGFQLFLIFDWIQVWCHTFQQEIRVCAEVCRQDARWTKHEFTAMTGFRHAKNKCIERTSFLRKAKQDAFH